MSNASLKEQLETLGLSTSPNETQQNHNKNQQTNNKKKKSPPEKGVKNRKPAWLEQAQYGVELLKAHFPLCFKEVKEISPLKIGLKQDLVKHLSTREDIVTSDKACMVSSVSYYVNSLAYHKRVVQGAARVDLDGNPAGIVTIEEAQYSLECRKTKLQKMKSHHSNQNLTEDETSK